MGEISGLSYGENKLILGSCLSSLMFTPLPPVHHMAFLGYSYLHRRLWRAKSWRRRWESLTDPVLMVGQILPGNFMLLDVWKPISFFIPLH